MSAATIIDLLTQLYEVYDTVDDARTCMDGAERAMKGKNPFPASDKVEARFKKLDKLAQELRTIATKGLGKPDQKRVSMDEIADPKTRSQAGKKFKENLAAADAFIVEGQKLLTALKPTAKEANARSRAAGEISKGFAKLVEAPLPDIGTVGKTEYFTLYQLFERAAGALGSVATDASKAQTRIAKDLAEVEDETANLRTNLKTLGVR